MPVKTCSLKVPTTVREKIVNLERGCIATFIFIRNTTNPSDKTNIGPTVITVPSQLMSSTLLHL